MNTDIQNSDHYQCPDIISRINSGLQKLGKSSNNVAIDDLATIDEFHLRGPMTTKDMIELHTPVFTHSQYNPARALNAPRFAIFR